eukprot:7792996-Pyramimonas_sp.AAC.1
MAAEQWESYSHATDVRKLYAILKAGVFRLSKLKWGMRAKTGKKAKYTPPPRAYMLSMKARRITTYTK